MKFAALFTGLLAAAASVSDACRCRKTDSECGLQYLMLVKINALNLDPAEHHGGHRGYSFQLVRDLSEQGAYKNVFSEIKTGFDHGSCQLDLEVGKVYLLGGQVDLKNNILWATTCGTYWKEWTLPAGSVKSNEALANISQRCKSTIKVEKIPALKSVQ